MPASTVHRVLVRHGVNRLRWMDRPTGRVIRRIETSRCGELVHIDVKKLARVPDGGGHKKLGRSTDTRRRRGGRGYTHIHTAIDAYSRLAYSEFAGSENAVNCVAFLTRAAAWFAERGIAIERVLTDNGVQFAQHDRRTERGFVDHIFGAVCSANDIEHRQTKPYHPWTNGQAERMVRTIKDATVKSFHYASITDLRRHVRDWLLAYNYVKQLKALRFKTPFEAIRQLSEKKPDIFIRVPSHDMLGQYT